MTNVRKHIEKIKNEYKTSNPSELCKAMDIEVLKIDLPDNIRGFFVNIMGQDFIYINEKLNGIEQEIVLCHELGHKVMHSDLNFFYMSTESMMATSRYEYEADCFASCILLDKKEFFNEYYEVMTLEEISVRTGIPLYYVNLRWEFLSNIYLC